MKPKFAKAVESGDLISARIFLANELMLDPRGASFHEMKALAESRFADLYEPSDGITYTVPESEWNNAFLTQLMKDLDSNFSKERLAFYERVAKIVLKEKIDELNREDKAKSSSSGTSTSSSYSTTTSEPRDGLSPDNKKYTYITAGGAVITITGLCLQRVALAGLGIIGVVIGGYLLYKNQKDE